MVTVLSVHNTGTRFLLYMISEVMGLDCQYVHFSPRFIPQLEELAGNVVMPVRLGRPVPCGYQKYIPPDTTYIQIEKSPLRHAQVDELVRRCGVTWTPELVRFVSSWKPIGASANPDDPKSQLVVEKFRRPEHAPARRD